MSTNLQTILLIQIFKHEEKKWNKITLVSEYCND